ncbi:TIR domain-containing protein [Candidatus Poribacteria bacterium]
MARKVFFSFHYKPDNWRAAQVRNMGVIEGNAPVSDNDWEAVTGRGVKAIEDWIDGQIKGKSCAVVLIGANTAGRKWINYEIEKSWNDGKGLFGIYIHNLKAAPVPPDTEGKQSSKGNNPFDGFTVGEDKKELSSIVKAYDPPFTTSTYVYNHIKENLADWVEKAIEIRDSFKGGS